MNVNAKRPRLVTGPRSRQGYADTCLTVCSRCGTTVFTWQDWSWSRDPLGISHTSLVDCGLVAR